MDRRIALTTVVTASALTLLAGCGSSSSGGSNGSSGGGGSNQSSAAPLTELTDAFHSLDQGSALTTTVSLDTTSANLIKLTGEGGSTPISQTQADLITGAKLTVEQVAPSGKTLAQVSQAARAAGSTSPLGGASLSVTGATGGTTYFTFLVVNQTLYLQVDLKGILTQAGQSSTYQSIVSQASSLPPFAQAFVAGKFVSLPFSTISQLSSLLEGAAQGQGSSIPSTSQLGKIEGQLVAAVLGDVTVTRTTTGSTDVLQISANIRDVAKDFLTTLATAVPQLASEIKPAEANQAPNITVNADASVTSGALSKLEFDFGQFSPGMKDSLPIEATFAKTGAPISAPSGAAAVNFQDLVSFFTSVGGSNSGAPITQSLKTHSK